MHSDWYQLGESALYRRVPVYDLNWNDINYSNYQLFPARFGGPIALVSNERQSISDLAIIITTSSAKRLCNITIKSTSRFVGIGWNAHEELMVLFENGK